MSVEVPNVPARRASARSAVWTLHAARLARGLPPGRNDPPRFAEVALERIIRDLIEQDADPPAGPDIRRAKINVGRFFDHQWLQAVRHRHPKRQPAIVAVVLGKHREAALARLDEEAGRAVRHLLERAGKGRADAADPIDLSFLSAFAPARRRVARRELPDPELRAPLDQADRHRLGQWEPERPLAALVWRQLLRERLDQRIACGIERVV